MVASAQSTSLPFIQIFAVGWMGILEAPSGKRKAAPIGTAQGARRTTTCATEWLPGRKRWSPTRFSRGPGTWSRKLHPGSDAVTDLFRRSATRIVARRPDAVGGGAFSEEIEHEGGRQDRRGGVGFVLARDVGRRAVYRL